MAVNKNITQDLSKKAVKICRSRSSKNQAVKEIPLKFYQKPSSQTNITQDLPKKQAVRNITQVLSKIKQSNKITHKTLAVKKIYHGSKCVKTSTGNYFLQIPEKKPSRSQK